MTLAELATSLTTASFTVHRVIELIILPDPRRPAYLSPFIRGTHHTHDTTLL